MSQLVLVEALLRTQQPWEVKRICCEKLINKAVEDASGYLEVKTVCQTLTDWILTSDTDFLKICALKGFSTLADQNRDIFLEICSPPFMIDLFSNPKYTNRLNLVGLVMVILKNVKQASGTSNTSTFLKVIRTQLMVYLRQHGINLSLAVSIAHLYRLHPDALPYLPQEVSKLCIAIVNLLCIYSVPTRPDQIGSFRRDTETLAATLPSLWAKDWTVGCQETLNAVYTHICEGSDPSMCLVSVIEKVPSHLLMQASHSILEQSRTEVGEAKLVRALSRLVDWLGMWPSKPLSIFILDLFMQVRRDQVTVLTAVAEVTASNICHKLPLPVFRSQLEPIFLFMLYGYQHSQTVFHSVVTHLPNVLKRLKTEGQTAQLAWEKLAEACRYLMDLFPGFPSLYEPLQNELLDSSEVSSGRKTQLATKAWLQSGSTVSTTGLVSESSSVTGGRVGLINLGNTCYMNSVIQALYHTTRFRSSVLESDPAPNQPLLKSLQQVFIFLRYSRRNIFSPSEFLRTARPPWFETGRQQDCSEFLTYLLDSLQEEESNVKEKKLKVENETQTVIENKACVSKLNETLEIVEDKILTEETNTQTSPEIEITHVEPVTSHLEDEDEDMHSYESQKELEDDIDEINDTLEENDTVLGGSLASLAEDKKSSRGSKGSLGMSRWSTEENLSTTSSREGLNISRDAGLNLSGSSREELLEIKESETGSKEEPSINDSHSNSTDSGIHSVGSNTYSSPVVSSSLVKRIFGGRLETTYTCLTCSTRSTDTDWFTDLHLAIPAVTAATSTAIQAVATNTNNPSTSTANPILAVSTATNTHHPSTSTADPIPPVSTATSILNSGTANPSTISQNSAGSTDTGQNTSGSQTIAQLNATNVLTVMPDGDSTTVHVVSDSDSIADSVRTEASSSNSELSGIPSPSSSVDISSLAVKSPEPVVNGKLGVPDLISSYLASEQMDGENQYQCDSCSGLRDAVKTVRLSSSPAYLNITLLRFKYDRAVGRRAKVFTPVDYPQRLKLPVVGGSVDYQLYSVVVHSGYSSDGGHYYTWARPDLNAPDWLILNDSQVTEASWSQFCNQATKLSRDTAYLLGYQRIEQNSVEETILESSPPRHLMDRVHKDNMRYFRERETSFRGAPGPRKEDDGGGGSGAGCPDNFGQFGGGHYIC